MNPTLDAATVQQAVTLFFVVGGGMLLLGLVKAALDIASFFRRSPPIDQTIAAIMREFNAQLSERVHIRDFNACEARHAQQVRDIEARHMAELRAMEGRIDGRLGGLHDSLVELRTAVLASITDVVKDLGYVQGESSQRRGGGNPWTPSTPA